jgi:LmbE family N-acetylglucosaminyl deacetylase
MARKTNALVVVAHPDDETLWAGGTILDHPDWRWTVIALCRRSDPDRAPRFARALDRLGAAGVIGDMDDSPDQKPLPMKTVESVIKELLPGVEWDIIFSHSPYGEYTRHHRHEEVGQAVTTLWQRGALFSAEVRLFAYEDGDRSYYPRAIDHAHILTPLEQATWEIKREIITTVYGFSQSSWEAQAAPRVEGFWKFGAVDEYQSWFTDRKE